MKVQRSAAILGISMVALTMGCANGPNRWARTVVERSVCGMSVAQVQALVGRRELRELHGRTVRGTHLSEKGLSRDWFDFEAGKLVGVQCSFTSAMARGEDCPQHEICR